MAQGVFYSLILLILFSSLQPGSLQEEPPEGCNAGLAEVFDEIKALMNTIKTETYKHISEFRSFRNHTENNFRSLRDDMGSLNDSVSNLSVCLKKHKQQTEAELEAIGGKVNTLYNQRFTCGGTGGWRRVVYLDMTDPSTTCPSGWNMTGYSKRTCGRSSPGPIICDSVTFSVSGGEYNRVCGRIKAYQWGSPDGISSYNEGDATTIDSAYVDGVIVTHGRSRFRQHIWTFAVGATEGNPQAPFACPCDADRTIRVPPFVGNDYFCESGVNEPWVGGSRHYAFHSNDPLWDGENCLPSSSCCSLHNPPYFVKQLPAPTTDDIEARICLDESLGNENIAVEQVEFYVQ